MIVADVNQTNFPLSSVHPGVVSLRGIHIVLFLAEFNGLESWGADIGNICLETSTKEKACIVSGLEFGPLQGHFLIINKDLCYLRTSGLR